MCGWGVSVRNMLRVTHRHTLPSGSGCRRVVDTVLVAHPLHRPRRQHVAGWFHTETGQAATVLAEPTLESPAAHTRSIGQFVFICALHDCFLLRYKVTK